jgi:aspartate racemase
LFFEADRTLALAHGCQTVMPAGTDLGLAFDGQAPGFPVLDCARVHADAIAAAALAP